MQGIFFTQDLLFSSRVVEAARSRGLSLQVVGSADALREAIGEDVALVLLDLTAAGCDPSQLVPDIKAIAAPPKVVAYGPHVQEGRLAAARQAGCDEVLTRGQFNQQIATVLERFLVE